MPCPFSFLLPLGLGLAVYCITKKGVYYGIKLPEITASILISFLIGNINSDGR